MLKRRTQKILIADDDEELRNLLKDMITLTYSSNVIIYEAKDGIEATWKIQNDDFSLLTTDSKMPKKSGIDVVESILMRKGKFPENIIILSGEVNELDVQRVPPSKKVKYLVKPFQMNSLMKLINACISIE